MINLSKFTRDERAKLAKEWLHYINERYPKEIDECIDNVSFYKRRDDELYLPRMERYSATQVRIIPTDSVSCLFEGLENPTDTTRKVAILNFASFKIPGGMFLNGSPAQEESLCHQSLLYPILSAFQEEYYDAHKKALNKSLYITDILYAPNVSFMDMSITKTDDGRLNRRVFRTRVADVITCAAPNVGSYIKYGRGKETDPCIEEELALRIRSILGVAKLFSIDDLILGAYGCGVFKCDPDMVSKLFFKMLMDTGKDGHYGESRMVYFPIPRSKKDHKNFDSFWKNWEPYIKEETKE